METTTVPLITTMYSDFNNNKPARNVTAVDQRIVVQSRSTDYAAAVAELVASTLSFVMLD